MIDQESRLREFAEKYGDMKSPTVIRVGDKLMSVIDGGIYQQVQGGPYNFPNILHDHALLFFGVPYLEAEETKSIGERHPALQWMYRYIDHREKLIREQPDALETDQYGFSAAWLRFAYDLYTIRDNVKLEARLKTRLLSKKDFQGARHELKVAALSIAAGFSIEFENEKDNTIGHAEFIGTDNLGVKIAVVAKSRHRHGVHGFEGGKILEPGSNADVRNIILDSYKKKTSLPLYAFIDANLPPAATSENLYAWWDEIYETMDELSKEGYADPCPTNVLFICNDPSHYVGDRQINNETDQLWILHFEAKNPRLPHPTMDMAARLIRAHEQRIAPPDEIPDFNSF